MKHAYVRPGTYRARVRSRRTINERGRTAIELTFAFTEQHLAGQLVTGRFWRQVLLERARALRQGQLVDVDVITKRSRRGEHQTTVRDFRGAGSPTVVSFVGGICTGSGGDSRAVHHEFGPAALCTERDEADLEEQMRALRERGIDPPPLPLLDSDTLADINGLILKGAKRGVSRSDKGKGCAPASSFAAVHSLAMESVGGKKGRRMLVNADDAFAAYASVESSVRPELPAHLSVFQYTDDLVLYQQAHAGSVAGYRGITWARRCVVDFDGQNGLADVLQPARYFVTALVRLGIPQEQILIFYSGNRGVHVMFPSCCAGMAPQTNFEFATGQFNQVIADQATLILSLHPRLGDGAAQQVRVSAPECGPRDDATWHEAIDWNMYSPNAMLRAPNTRHEETGLYKVRLTVDEFHSLDIDEIQKIAAAPRPFEPPAWKSPTLEVLGELWSYAVAVANSRTFAVTQSVDAGSWVYGDTFDFMHNGAPELTRAKRLFRAAVNLLQVGCSRKVAYQLLSPAALMSGLGPAETEQQIEGAVAYLRKRRPVRLDAGFAPPGVASDGPSDLNGGK